MRSPIEVFSNWVDTGKDEGMEKNHFKPVIKMIDLFDTNKEFTCIDAGCGNGWLVKYLSKMNNCKKAIGVDGSSKMIAKAKKHSDNEFYCSDLLECKPKNKVDFKIVRKVQDHPIGTHNDPTLLNEMQEMWSNIS